ncbi:AMP-binding protein [Acidimicrobiia bacterium EGI L10123]|uniref:AMP-binding protein n=1 Tax=Salinilacustrithrix flava TaxID=2957203 RepID=UPI003D7C28AE|nr:AMP-binding protein [Acidimicrobiia bacterium EGI L10123]
MPSLFDRVCINLQAVDTVRRMGLLHPKMATTALQSAKRWGPTLAAGFAAGVARRGDQAAIVDDDGTLTFRQVHQQSSALANALADRGVGPETPVALLARNSRWFVLAVAALDKLGATVLYMNTGFAGPQLAEVLEREGCDLLLHDDEFSVAVAGYAPDVQRLVCDRAPADGTEDLPALVAAASTSDPAKPERQGRQVILTSGTTGTPKGASRSKESLGAGLAAATAIFQRVPFRTEDVHAVPAPMFHSLGNASLLAAATMSHTLVLARRFEPEHLLAQIEAHRVRVVTVVPVMLQRILALPTEVTERYDTSSLEVVFCSGSALPGSLATQWMDRFGDNLYNMFGSTEVAVATIATPEDLRAAPGTAGKPLSGVDVRLYDDDDREITEPDTVGRIFVGSALRFEGYTGGQTKPSIDGLLSSGDLGRFDADGRLFVGGRDDDMIVSGGENLFPSEVEDLLSDMAGVREVAVFGVEDDQFGQRLAAFVVPEDGVTLDDRAIKDHVRANLANYKVPRSVWFLDELPRNPTGKVLKRELRQRFPDA